MTGRHAQRRIGIVRKGRDGGRERHGEQVLDRAVGSDLVYLQREIVGRRDSGDRRCTSIRVFVEPLDRAQIGNPRSAVDLARAGAEECTHDVAGRHLHILQRRGVVDAGPEVERPGLAVGRDRGRTGRQIWDGLGALEVRHSAIGHQGPYEAASQQLELGLGVGGLRVEPVVGGFSHGHLEGAAPRCGGWRAIVPGARGACREHHRCDERGADARRTPHASPRTATHTPPSSSAASGPGSPSTARELTMEPSAGFSWMTFSEVAHDTQTASSVAATAFGASH